MLFLFTVAFIVTLLAAVYMQFSPQAERFVLQYNLHPGAFFLGAVLMTFFCLQALRNSGVSNDTGLFLLLISFVPFGLMGFKIDKIQDSFAELYELGKELNEHRTKVGMKEHHAVLFFIEMERINDGQTNRVYRALLAKKRYHQYGK